MSGYPIARTGRAKEGGVMSKLNKDPKVRTLDEVTQENAQTVIKWIERASGGVLTAIYRTREESGDRSVYLFGEFAIQRSDGRPLGWFRDMPVVAFIMLPASDLRYKAMDGRSRRMHRAVMEAVNEVKREYLQGPDRTQVAIHNHESAF
jgi:hypothetical protein